MLLPSIETPADLQLLSEESSSSWRPRSGRSSSTPSRRPAGTWARTSGVVELTHRAAPGLRLPSRRPALRHRPPGLRPQAAHRASLRLQGPEAAGRAVGLPVPRGVRARLDRELARLDRPLLRPRPLDRLRAARRAPGPRREPPRRRRRRRRLAHRRDGLRGAEQPRPLRAALRDRAQRQRSQLRPDRVAPQRVADEPAAAPHLRPGARAAPPGAPRDPRRRRVRLHRRPRRDLGAARDRDPAHLLRDPRRPLRRPDRRPRRDGHGAVLPLRRRVGRPDRGPRAHREGPRLRARRAGRRPAAPRLPGPGARDRRGPRGPPAELHRRLLARARRARASTTTASSRSPRRCPARRGSSRSRSGSRRGSSTSGSPSSTR